MVEGGGKLIVREALWREGLKDIFVDHIFTFAAGTWAQRSVVVVRATVVMRCVASIVLVVAPEETSYEQPATDVEACAEDQCDQDDPPVGGDRCDDGYCEKQHHKAP